jgi:hypothetical protein
MPAVQAVGIASDRPASFRLPVLDDRGDVAARRAAIDSMIIDDSHVPPGAAQTAPLPATPTDRDAPANRARTPEARFTASAGVPSANSPKPAAGTSAVGTSAVGTSAVGTSAVGTSAIGTSAIRASRDRDAEPTGPTNGAPDVAAPGNGHDAGEGGEAARAARVRAAVTLPAHARMIRPDGDQAAAPVSYTADDWRGHIKGAPARPEARVYGAAGGPDSANPVTAELAAPTPPSGDVTKPISILDRAARVALLGTLLAIFVLLFIFGPKISQWWGMH